MKNRLAYWIATCGLLGRSKFAPGSLGSLVGVFLVLLTASHFAAFVILFSALLLIGIWASRVVSSDLGQSDPSLIVIDEACGMMISFLLIPMDWQNLVVGFLCFRFFDIVKPPPIRSLEHFPNGLGIVLDDLGAGIYTNLILHFVIRYAHL